MSRELSWDELPDRLAQLAGHKPLPSGRTLAVIRSSVTLESGWVGVERPAVVFAGDDGTSVRIRTHEDRLLIDVYPTTFIVVRAEFRRAVEAKMQGDGVNVDIWFAPDLALNLQFEYFDDPYSTD